MARRLIALVVLVAAVIAAAIALSRACDGGDDGGGPLPSGVTPTPGNATEVTREHQGIVLKLSIDEEEYEVGEEIAARAEVKNTRGDDITYQGPPGEDGFRLQVISDLGGAQPLPADDGDGPPPQGTLESGDSLKTGGKWDQRIDFDADPVQAPEGTYSIRATFLAQLQGLADVVTIQAVVTFKLKGGGFILDPNSVLTAAVNNEELRAWMDGRAENVICAYSTRGLYYQGFTPTGPVAETSDFLYSSQIEEGLPICGIGTDGDAWRLNFYSRVGDPPHRVNLVMELDDAKLIRFEEVPEPSGAAETPSPTPVQ